MFYSKKLKRYKDINHCFFSKRGGVSKGIYKGLNCGLNSKDKKTNVLKNLDIVRKKIGNRNTLLITFSQKHTNKVFYLKSIKKRIVSDGIVTKIKNLAVGVLTADCVPILFYDPIEKISGCVHAGWKGAYKGIIKNTIRKFLKLNSLKKNIVVAIGPCIKKKNYEVKYEFYKKFLKKNKANKIFFTKKNKNKYYFNLRNFVNKQLLDLGIKKIDNIKLDTFSDKKNFYSYRRSNINKEKDYGRNISVILMT